MASDQYRQPLPGCVGPAPLPFVASSFVSPGEAGEAPPPYVSGAVGAYGAYPPAPGFGGPSFASFDQPLRKGGSMMAFGGTHSFDDEPPLLEGAFHWLRSAPPGAERRA